MSWIVECLARDLIAGYFCGKSIGTKIEYHKSEVIAKPRIAKPRSDCSQEGVAMESDRVAAIAEWPIPHREVQVFLGFANFYRRFVERYSSTVAPLTGLHSTGGQILSREPIN
jgi:hypothetical protein